MTKRWTSRNPAVEAVAKQLEAAFAKVEKRLKAELKAEYRAEADRNFKWLMQAAKDPKNTGFIERVGGMPWWDFAAFDRDGAVKAWERTRKNADDYSGYPPNNTDRWDDVRTWARFMRVDYRDADESAVRAFDRARDAFIMKNMGKVENVLGGRKDAVKGEVRFEFRNRVFQGDLRVELPDGRFAAEIGLKWVVRTIPRVTPYFQYPLVFTEALVGGKTHRRPSEEELRILLGGGPAKTPEEIRAEKGYCSGSAKDVPAAVFAKVAARCTPYLGCPECGQIVSVKGGRYRTHYPKRAKKEMPC